MLHLIFGMAGAGKTTLLHERIADCVSDGGRAILLVPEQYSFESEKALYRRLDARGALQVEVLSFTRLCDRIFREYGGLAGVHLEEAAKYLLMSVALGEVGGALKVYGKNAANAAFAASMCEQISELKTAGASSEALRGAAQGLGGAFGDKLSDIALIFDAYQAVIERGYSDPDDCLARACKRLEGRNFFAGYDVFIDGFMAFMGAEWKLLKFVLADSPHVWAALTCMGLWQGDGTGALACAAHTAARRPSILVGSLTCTWPFSNQALALRHSQVPLSSRTGSGWASPSSRRSGAMNVGLRCDGASISSVGLVTPVSTASES